MRKFVFLGIAGMMALAAFITITMLPGQGTDVAQADPDGSNPQSASIFRDFGCALFDGDDNLTLADASKTVVTSSGNGNLKCSAQVSLPLDGKAHVLKGFGCNTQAGFTTKTHSTVSASGKSTLTCQVK